MSVALVHLFMANLFFEDVIVAGFLLTVSVSLLEALDFVALDRVILFALFD